MKIESRAAHCWGRDCTFQTRSTESRYCPWCGLELVDTADPLTVGEVEGFAAALWDDRILPEDF